MREAGQDLSKLLNILIVSALTLYLIPITITAPTAPEVTFTLYHSADQAYQDYQNNKLDTTPVPLSMFASNQKNQEFHQVPLLWINYYSMNYLTPPFNNIHIRQAFALAIDKQAIVNNVWKGTVEATNHIVPPELQGSNLNFTGPDGTKSLSGDPKKAQDLLNQGLHEEGGIVFRRYQQSH